MFSKILVLLMGFSFAAQAQSVPNRCFIYLSKPCRAAGNVPITRWMPLTAPLADSSTNAITDAAACVAFARQAHQRCGYDVNVDYVYTGFMVNGTTWANGALSYGNEKGAIQYLYTLNFQVLQLTPSTAYILLP